MQLRRAHETTHALSHRGRLIAGSISGIWRPRRRGGWEISAAKVDGGDSCLRHASEGEGGAEDGRPRLQLLHVGWKRLPQGCMGCMAVAAMRSSALGTQRVQFFARNGRSVWDRMGDDVRDEKRVPPALNMAGMLRVVFGGESRMWALMGGVVGGRGAWRGKEGDVGTGKSGSVSCRHGWMYGVCRSVLIEQRPMILVGDRERFAVGQGVTRDAGAAHAQGACILNW
jgi:hypothetical protein